MKAKRLITLQDRKDNLLGAAEATVQPFKFDPVSFAEENLFERYRTKNGRLTRIQKLVRRITAEEANIIDSILQSKE